MERTHHTPTLALQLFINHSNFRPANKVLCWLAVFLGFPISVSAQTNDASFCADTIRNGYLSFNDNFTINRVGHVNTQDSGTLAFAEIKNGAIEQTRVIKIDKSNAINWALDFSWASPGYRLSVQQAADSGGDTYYAGILQKQDNTLPPQVFIIRKFGNTLFGLKKCFKLSSAFNSSVTNLSVTSLSVSPQGQVLIGFSLSLQNYSYSGLLCLAPDCSLRWSKLFGDLNGDDQFSTIGALFTSGERIVLSSAGITATINNLLPRKENLVFTQLDTAGNVSASKRLSIDRNNIAPVGVGNGIGYFKQRGTVLYPQVLFAGDYTIPGSEPMFYVPVLDTGLLLLRSEQFRNTSDRLGSNTRYSVDWSSNQMRVTSQPLVDSTLFVAVFHNSVSQWQRAYKLPFKQANTVLSLSEHPLKNDVFKLLFAQKNDTKLYVHRLQFNPPSEVGCSSERDTSVINALTVPYLYQLFSWPQIQSGVLEAAPEQITISTPNMAYTPSCTLMIGCNSILLSGPSNVCDSDSLYEFRAMRSAGCTNLIKWRIDTALTQVIQMVNDTTIRIKFLPGQVVQVKAMLIGCTVLSDSLNVYIKNAPPALLSSRTRYICQGQSLTVMLPNGYQQYQWNSTNSQSVLITMPGNYIASAIDSCGRLHTDTLHVLLDSALYNPTHPQYIKCSEDSVTITAPMGYQQYQWSPVIGAIASSNQLKVWTSQPTTYSLNFLSPLGCSYNETYTFQIAPSPQLTLPNDTAICEGLSLQIAPKESFTNYQWNTGDTTPTLSVQAPGMYILNAKSFPQCAARDTFQLLPSLSSPKNFLVQDTGICALQPLTLLPKITGFISYLWSTGSTQSAITVQTPGRYWLEVIAPNGCRAKEWTTVKEKGCRAAIYFPTAFTPNGDGKNEVFKAICFQTPAYFELSVYDRWGELIFHTKNPSEGWRGLIRGKEQATGSFVWYCIYQFAGEKQQLVKGTVLLIR